MGRFTAISERGQVTIPKLIRNKLSIDTSTKLKVYEEDGRIIIEPQSTIELLTVELEKEARRKRLTREQVEKKLDSLRKAIVEKLS